MNPDWLVRNNVMFGTENVALLQSKTVIILGIGGVGSYVAEALARSNIGTLHLVDSDIIEITNLNRQIHALHSTLGMKKTEAMKQRILDINPDCNVVTQNVFLDKTNINDIILNDIDYVVDALDTITSKIEIMKYCLSKNIKFISSMGTANKVNPNEFIITDLEKTEVDPIARVIRQQLRKDKIRGKIKVAYSKELPQKRGYEYDNRGADITKNRYILGSNAFVPSSVGLLIASYVVKDLMQWNKE